MRAMKAFLWVILGMTCAMYCAAICLCIYEKSLDSERMSYTKADLVSDRAIFESLWKDGSQNQSASLSLKNGDWVRMLVVDSAKEGKSHLFYAVSSDGSRVKKRCQITCLTTPSGELDTHLRLAAAESRTLREFWLNPQLEQIGVNMRDNFDAAFD